MDDVGDRVSGPLMFFDVVSPTHVISVRRQSTYCSPAPRSTRSSTGFTGPASWEEATAPTASTRRTRPPEARRTSTPTCGRRCRTMPDEESTSATRRCTSSTVLRSRREVLRTLPDRRRWRRLANTKRQRRRRVLPPVDQSWS